MSITLDIKIYKTRYKCIPTDVSIKMEIIKILNEGAYGVIMLSNMSKYVLKLFKQTDNIIDENDIILVTNEFEIFNKLLNINKNEYPPNLVFSIATGYLENNISYKDKIYEKNTKLVLMPYYLEFYSVYKQFKNFPLIYHKNYNNFIINLIVKILKTIIYIVENMRLINIDIKINNIMYSIDDIVVIDLGLMYDCNSKNKTYKYNGVNYSGWPKKNCDYSAVPVYSIAICIIELIFGKDSIPMIENYNKILENELNNEAIVELLKNMLSLKYDAPLLLKYIEQNFNLNDIMEDKAYFPIIENLNIENWYNKVMSTVFICKMAKNKYNLEINRNNNDDSDDNDKNSND